MEVGDAEGREEVEGNEKGREEAEAAEGTGGGGRREQARTRRRARDTAMGARHGEGRHGRRRRGPGRVKRRTGTIWTRGRAVRTQRWVTRSRAVRRRTTRVEEEEGDAEGRNAAERWATRATQMRATRGQEGDAEGSREEVKGRDEGQNEAEEVGEVGGHDGGGDVEGREEAEEVVVGDMEGCNVAAEVGDTGGSGRCSSGGRGGGGGRRGLGGRGRWQAARVKQGERRWVLGVQESGVEDSPKQGPRYIIAAPDSDLHPEEVQTAILVWCRCCDRGRQWFARTQEAREVSERPARVALHNSTAPSASNGSGFSNDCGSGSGRFKRLRLQALFRQLPGKSCGSKPGFRAARAHRHSRQRLNLDHHLPASHLSFLRSQRYTTVYMPSIKHDELLVGQTGEQFVDVSGTGSPHILYTSHDERPTFGEVPGWVLVWEGSEASRVTLQQGGMKYLLVDTWSGSTTGILKFHEASVLRWLELIGVRVVGTTAMERPEIPRVYQSTSQATEVQCEWTRSEVVRHLLGAFSHLHLIVLAHSCPIVAAEEEVQGLATEEVDDLTMDNGLLQEIKAKRWWWSHSSGGHELPGGDLGHPLGAG
ncbi:uncharacterized protein BXZ73DRAFT_80878 [Epithele typhae]|uniref:uncharacterized protein n=1 Tax=Epithele typhae TaxID=378194 RepID=UPI002007EB32|nr:uncharacterized protein BXZ73DRAFT_80878 [Epithele typhae]KAH9917117.1 hypothetical protein BXZ73DRAFT_80878 [Epithele typhae]